MSDKTIQDAVDRALAFKPEEIIILTINAKGDTSMVTTITHPPHLLWALETVKIATLDLDPTEEIGSAREVLQ
jgi:hypothetical protein